MFVPHLQNIYGDFTQPWCTPITNSNGSTSVNIPKLCSGSSHRVVLSAYCWVFRPTTTYYRAGATGICETTYLVIRTVFPAINSRSIERVRLFSIKHNRQFVPDIRCAADRSDGGGSPLNHDVPPTTSCRLLHLLLTIFIVLYRWL